MSALPIWEEILPLEDADLPPPERSLLGEARAAFLADSHYVIDMMNAANRVLAKRSQQRSRTKVAVVGT